MTAQSTGPRTSEGKAISSRNSFKHGLYSKNLVLPNEDPAELDALRADLFAEHQPQTETEALLVNEMADQYWRLRRARRMEVLFLKNEAIVAHITAAQRMMSTAERGFYKALKSITELQRQRGFVPQKAAASQTVSHSRTESVPETNVIRAATNGSGPAESPRDSVGFDPQTDLELREIDEELAAIERSLHA